VLGVSLAAVAVLGEWTGLGRLSGPASIGALAAVLLAFALSNPPGATGERDVGDHVPRPSRPAGAEGD
jgi:hypothetical protein